MQICNIQNYFPWSYAFISFATSHNVIPSISIWFFFKIKWRIYVFVNNVNIDSDIGMLIIQREAII